MKINYLCILFLLLFTSCLEDIGNYNYKEINEIKIEGVTDQVLYDLISHQDHLTINPDLFGTFSEDDLSELTYEWKLVPRDESELPEDPDAYIIGREKNINHYIVESPGNYYGLYRVTDKSTGNTFSKRFFVQVRALTTEGWAVLCDDEGKTRFDWFFRQAEDKEYVLSNLWSEENYDPIMGYPIGLNYSYEMGTGLTLRLVTTEKGTYNLDNIEQKAGEDRNIKYWFGEYKENITVAASSPMLKTRNRKVVMLITEEGDVYTREVQAAGAVFGYRENRLSNEEEYFVAAPFIGLPEHKTLTGSNTSIILYDQKGCRFVEYTTSAQYGTLVNWRTNDLFPNTVNLEMIDMQTVNGKVFSILRDKDTNETHLFAFKIGGGGVNTQEFYMKLEGTDIEKTTVFAFDPLWSHVFYSHGGKIYTINITNDVNAQKPSTLRTWSIGEVVKMTFPDFAAWTKYEDWFVDTKYKLHVAGNKFKQKDEGFIQIFSFQNAKLTKEKEFIDGFGKIIDIEYFERD